MEWEKQEQHHLHHHHHHSQQQQQQQHHQQPQQAKEAQQPQQQGEGVANGTAAGGNGVLYVKVMTDEQMETLRKQIAVYASICEQLVEMHKNLTAQQDLAGLPLLLFLSPSLPLGPRSNDGGLAPSWLRDRKIGGC